MGYNGTTINWGILPPPAPREPFFEAIHQMRHSQKLKDLVRAELDRREGPTARTDSGPQWARWRTNDQLRKMHDDFEVQASNHLQQALNLAHEREVNPHAVVRQPSEDERARIAEASAIVRNNLGPGDRVYTNENSVYEITPCGTTVSTKLPPNPKKLDQTDAYSSAVDSRLEVLGIRAADACRPIKGSLDAATRFIAPASRSFSSGYVRPIIGFQGGVSQALSGKGFSKGYRGATEWDRQEEAQHRARHPVAHTVMDGLGQLAQARLLNGVNLLASSNPLGKIGQEAVKGFVSNAAQAYNSKDGDFVDEALAALGGGINGMAVSGSNAMLPRLLQSDGISVGANIALDKTIGSIKKNEQDDDPAPYLSAGSINEIVKRDGMRQRVEREPEIPRYYGMEMTPALPKGKGAETLTQVYPLSSGLRESAQTDEPEMPLDPPSNTVIDGKIFISGDPKDPRNWLTLPSAR